MERPGGGAPFFCIGRAKPDYGFFTSNLICLRMPASFGNSSAPAGNLFELNMNARMSAFCCPLNEPGAFCGIEMRTRSKRSPIVRPSHPAMNSPPARGGAISPPVSSPPWHEAQFSAYSALPRVACASVKTPSQIDLVGGWACTVEWSTRIVEKGMSAAAAILMFMDLSGYRHETLYQDCTT